MCLNDISPPATGGDEPADAFKYRHPKKLTSRYTIPRDWVLERSERDSTVVSGLRALRKPWPPHEAPLCNRAYG